MAVLCYATFCVMRVLRYAALRIPVLCRVLRYAAVCVMRYAALLRYAALCYAAL